MPSSINKTCTVTGTHPWDLQRSVMTVDEWIWSHTFPMAFALHTDNTDWLNFSPLTARTIRAEPQRANGSLAGYVSL